MVNIEDDWKGNHGNYPFSEKLVQKQCYSDKKKRESMTVDRV